jgi:hypothetical protein
MRLCRHGLPVYRQGGDYVTDNPPTYEHAEMADAIDRRQFAPQNCPKGLCNRGALTVEVHGSFVDVEFAEYRCECIPSPKLLSRQRISAVIYTSVA